MRLIEKPAVFPLILTAFVALTGCTGTAAKEETCASVDFKERRLKILQVTDVHYVVGSEDSAGSLARLNNILDIEKPDVVAFTGDIVVCDEQQQGWDEVLETVISRQIPWGAVLGNHDHEYTWTREQIMDHICDKPYSLTGKGPDITGAGNFIVTVNGPETGNPAALLYFMDSGSYSTIEGVRGYGWFGFDQIEWYRKQSESFRQKNGGQPLPALAFFHIPLPEYMQMTRRPNASFTGIRDERECPGTLNTGMFAAMLESGDVMCTFVGHDHNNDYIGTYNGLGLAYGHFSGSKTTYTDIGCGARVIVLKEGQRSFDTWIRTGDGEKRLEVNFPSDLQIKEVNNRQ